MIHSIRTKLKRVRDTHPKHLPCVDLLYNMTFSMVSEFKTRGAWALSMLDFSQGWPFAKAKTDNLPAVFHLDISQRVSVIHKGFINILDTLETECWARGENMEHREEGRGLWRAGKKFSQIGRYDRAWCKYSPVLPSYFNTWKSKVQQTLALTLIFCK